MKLGLNGPRLPDPKNIVGGGGGGRLLFSWSLARSLLSFSFATSSSKMEGWSLYVISGGVGNKERVKWDKMNRPLHYTLCEVPQTADIFDGFKLRDSCKTETIF